MLTREEVERLAAMADAASHDERLADGMLYRNAAAALLALLTRAETAERERDAARARAIEEAAQRIEPKSPIHDWTDARIRADAAFEIRALADD